VGNPELVICITIYGSVRYDRRVGRMRHLSGGLLVVLALLAASCAGTKSAQPAPSSPTDGPVITGQPAGVNADDVAFATNMIASYDQTTELTELVPAHSTDPELIALASDIGAGQGPELQMMKAFLVQWHESPDAGSGQGGHGESVTGTVDHPTMTQLGSLSGTEFETLWLRAMVGHQQGAITMAQAEVANGTNVDAIAAAKQLVGTYQAQIGRMQKLLADR
jgi:uncharacterized protein (DUF305 family)